MKREVVLTIGVNAQFYDMLSLKEDTITNNQHLTNQITNLCSNRR